jgi:S-adenosylmethionine decarboxylase
MFFEGTEKKFELIAQPTSCSFRSFDQMFWKDIVALAKAEIISVISNEQCDAYLLSESSLFVWDKRVVVITCGLSTLIDSLLALIDRIGVVNVSFVCYQRKNEYLAHLQASTFVDDIARLRQVVPGNACRIGHLDSHHHFIFTTDGCSQPELIEPTSELLMYHISGEFAQYLLSQNQSKEQIIHWLQLDIFFPGFLYDCHLFSPLGFSVNGIKGDRYFTIHITPQEQSSYVSVETNIDLTCNHSDIAANYLAMLKPISWDFIGFNCTLPLMTTPDNICLAHCTYAIGRDTHVNVSHFQQVSSECLSPEIL